jgi:hypothetical protein
MRRKVGAFFLGALKFSALLREAQGGGNMFDLREITSIGARLYMDRTNDTLYHFTWVGSALGVVEDRMLYATDAYPAPRMAVYARALLMVE